MRSRIASTPLFDAASSSTRSKNVPASDGLAVLALAAGLAVGAEVEAVERPGEDARGGGLAGAARAREQIGVAGAILAHRVLQRVGDGILADQLGEMLGPVLAVQRGHESDATDADYAALGPLAPCRVRRDGRP